jgi:2-hydroxychromene-2-carboxylate isomerase
MMRDTISARWYFDIISPFAYLHLRRFDQLDPALKIEFVPVLFAGLLKALGHKGPAEIPAKRIFTYQHCVWLASQYGVPFKMPPRHPFNPLKALRLLVALDAEPRAVAKTFDFVFANGCDPELDFLALCDELEVADGEQKIADRTVKEKLIRNTEQALAQGVFGVPTLQLRDQLFWGSDCITWTNAFVADPKLFEHGEMQRVRNVDIGVQRLS